MRPGAEEAASRARRSGSGSGAVGARRRHMRHGRKKGDLADPHSP